MVCILTNLIAEIAYSPMRMSKPWFCESFHCSLVLFVLRLTSSHNLLVSLHFSYEPQAYYYIFLLTQFRTTKLSVCILRLVPLFVRGRLHTEASQEKPKRASPIL